MTGLDVGSLRGAISGVASLPGDRRTMPRLTSGTG